MMAVEEEAERRMDLRFGILAAAILNVIGQLKEPVAPMDIYQSLRPRGDGFPDPDELTEKIARVMRVAGE